jgi:hypothetical protein
MQTIAGAAVKGLLPADRFRFILRCLRMIPLYKISLHDPSAVASKGNIAPEESLEKA